MKRRNFNKLAGISVASPLIPIAAIKAAHASDANMLDPKSPQASALAYKIESDNPDQNCCLLYTSPSPRDATLSRMPSSA